MGAQGAGRCAVAPLEGGLRHEVLCRRCQPDLAEQTWGVGALRQPLWVLRVRGHRPALAHSTAEAWEYEAVASFAWCRVLLQSARILLPCSELQAHAALRFPLLKKACARLPVSGTGQLFD